MSYETFFRNSSVEDTNWFDEGPKFKPTVLLAVNSSSISTVDIDGYRQGVEITQQKHFDAGTVKIHAGNPGHVMLRNAYGQDKNFRLEPQFEELDYFDPLYFIRAQNDYSPLLYTVITFPIITGDSDQLENYYYDGAIEPFPIREVAAFFTTEVPFRARGVRGTLMSGNDDTIRSNEQVLTVDVFEPNNEQVGYLDMVDLIGGRLPLNGYFRHDKSRLTPFDDTRYVRNTITLSTYSDEMTDTLSLMTGSTANYINFKEKSATSGWSFENSSVGTDSLVFGGMTY